MGRVFLVMLCTGFIFLCSFSDHQSTKLIQTKYSKKAVRLVLKYMGKKVGSGTSLALLQLYEKKAKAKTALKFSLSKKTANFIAVGDELYFSGTYKDTKVSNTVQSIYHYAGPMHYAIVVGKKDDNTLIVAHQNIFEKDNKRAAVTITELSIEDSARFENINVYGLWPRKGKVNPERILVRDGPEYEINPFKDEKIPYFANYNFTR